MLKVHNEGDSSPESQYAEAQNALLGVLAARGFPVPAPLPLQATHTTAGSSSSSSRSADGYTLRMIADDGRRHAVRMLSWLPGTLLVDVAQVGGQGEGRSGAGQCWASQGRTGVLRLGKLLDGPNNGLLTVGSTTAWPCLGYGVADSNHPESGLCVPTTPQPTVSIPHEPALLTDCTGRPHQQPSLLVFPAHGHQV